MKMADNNLTQKSKGFITEFKEFISKGNVMDMAVGIIIGGAFTAIVSSLVDDILMPLIGTILVGLNFNSLNWVVPWGNHPVIRFGSFITAIITFLLTAFALFMIIKAVNKLKRKKDEAPAEPPKPSNEEVLLSEIRDLLKDQK